MKEVLEVLHFILKILLFGVALIAVCLGIDFITGAINNSLNKTSYNNTAFHYRISGINDLKMEVKETSQSFFVQQFSSDSAEVYVIAMKVVQDNPLPELSNRFTYRYSEVVDSICFPGLKQLELIKEDKPFYSWKIAKEYSNEESVKIKTITIFAREFVYIFYQQYEKDTHLLDRLEENFKSSRTFCFQNIIAVWLDKIAVGLAISWVSSMLNWFWTFGCFILCLGLSVKVGNKFSNVFLNFTFMILCILLFSYLALHDSFMDWIMSYGSFLEIPAQLIDIFFGGD